MNTTLGSELSQILETAAQQASLPGEEFFSAVRRGVRSRRRRRRGFTVAVAAATTLAMVGGIEATSLTRHAAPPAATIEHFQPAVGVVPPATASDLPDFTNIATVDQVWPDLIRRLPITTPDGHSYTVHNVLPGNRYLVDWRGPIAWMLGVLDPTTSSLVTIANTGELTSSFVVLGVSGGRAIWYSGSGGATQIWSSQLDGDGTLRLAAPQPKDGAELSRIALAGDHVVWGMAVPTGDRSVGDGWAQYVGLYQVSVAGGPVATIPHSDGYIPSWYLPDLVNTGHPSSATTTGKVWDLTENESRTWTRNTLMADLSCGLDWCGGVGVDQHAAVQRRDGSGYLELLEEGRVYPLAGGRFALIVFDGPNSLLPSARAIMGSALWDLKTGRVANLGSITVNDPLGSGESAPLRSAGVANLVVAWEQGGEVLLLDLNQIP